MREGGRERGEGDRERKGGREREGGREGEGRREREGGREGERGEEEGEHVHVHVDTTCTCNMLQYLLLVSLKCSQYFQHKDLINKTCTVTNNSLVAIYQWGFKSKYYMHHMHTHTHSAST